MDGLNAVLATWKVLMSTEHRSPCRLEMYAGPIGETVIEFREFPPQATVAVEAAIVTQYQHVALFCLAGDGWLGVARWHVGHKVRAAVPQEPVLSGTVWRRPVLGAGILSAAFLGKPVLGRSVLGSIIRRALILGGKVRPGIPSRLWLGRLVRARLQHGRAIAQTARE